jgi:hypothetical protein
MKKIYTRKIPNRGEPENIAHNHYKQYKCYFTPFIILQAAMDIPAYIHRPEDFPPFISNSSSCYISYFREQFVFFQFNLTNKHEFYDFTSLFNRFVQVLSLLKKQIQNNPKNLKYIEILDNYYKLILSTRDISYGKGERKLTYLLITAFYEVYPTLAIYALHQIIPTVSHDICQDFSAQQGSLTLCGSWKDAIGLCDFIRNFSKQGDQHALVELCIELIVKQVIFDNHTWKFTEHAMDTRYISNVAKWIPREKKKYSWLFEPIAIHWAKQVYPYILNSAENDDSKRKAITKCKCRFRKQISYLNKRLLTPEIKMTQSLWDDIEPINVNQKTYMKHFDKLTTYYPEFCHKYDTNIPFHNKLFFGSLPTYDSLIKHAIRIINSPNQNGSIGLQRTSLNHLWKQMMRHLKKGAFQFTIPVIDVSQTMVYNDTNAFYNAVGIALSVACNSSIESRVIAVANSSIWIQFHHTDDFVDIVDNFFTSIAPIQGSPLLQNTSINLIIQGIKGSYSTTRFVDNLNILFVSDFSQNNVFHLHELYPNVKDLFIQNGFDVAPYVFYWNVSTHHTLDVSTIMDYTKNRVFSGSSIHLLHDFIYIIEKQTHDVFSPYEAAVFSVDKHRYLPLSTYLYSWFSTYPM